jgi:predicted anti-sigma-YlaC factor YlaD
MKTCDEARAVLDLHVFGEADDRDEALLHEHLRGCDACRAEERRLLAWRDAARGERLAPGDALRGRIERALAARARPEAAPAWRRPVPAYVAFAAAIFGAVAVVALRAPREGVGVAPVETDAAPPARIELPESPAHFVTAGSYDTRVANAGTQAVQDTAKNDSL